MSEYSVLAKISSSVNVRDLEVPAAIELQKLLANGRYYESAIDGIPGKQTSEALAEFKRLNYLEHPELVGATTVKRLIELHSEAGTEDEVYRGDEIALPDGQLVHFNDLILPDGHFTWAEATNGDSRRVPPSVIILRNIERIATELEGVRTFFGNVPIKINSWYRPPAINRAVGGAVNSTHLEGHAVDVVPIGVNLYTAQRNLDGYWGDRGGVGFGAPKGFVHLDLRGWRARWNY